MRVAVCISGEMRTFNPSHYRSVFGDVDFFVHTNEPDPRIEQLKPVDYNYEEIDFRSHPYHKINKDIQPEEVINSIQRVHPFINELDFSSHSHLDLEVERPGKWSSKPKHVLSMFYSIMQCNFLKKSFEVKNGFKYDFVVRTRPDIEFSEPINYSKYDCSLVCVPQTPKDLYFYANDHFAVSSSENMDSYSTAFINIPRLYYIDRVDFIPEILLRSHLNSLNIKTKEVPMDYVVRRNDGRDDVYMRI